MIAEPNEVVFACERYEGSEMGVNHVTYYATHGSMLPAEASEIVETTKATAILNKTYFGEKDGFFKHRALDF